MSVNSQNVNNTEENEINLQQIFEQYSYYWRWFVVSVVACILAAFIYLRYAEKIYAVSSKVLLQDDKQASGELAGLSELATLAGGGSQTQAFVSDQIDVIKSRRIFRKVVEKNKLNITYSNKGSIKSTDLLEVNSPFKLVFLDINPLVLDSIQYSLSISGSPEKGFTIKDHEQTIHHYKFGNKIKTSFGTFMLTPNGEKVFSGDFSVTISPIDRIVDGLLTDVQVSPNKDKQSFIVNFSMNSPNREKAILIINSLIEQYNDDVTYDKNRLIEATSDFINSRLKLISDDLATADSKVADFKDRNSLIDMSSEARLYMETASENEKKLVEYQTQLMLADMIGSSVGEGYALLPSNIGLTDQSIAVSITTYNQLILEREDLLRSATPDNPTVRNIESNIKDLQKNLINSLGNYRKVLQANVSSIEKQRNKFEGKLGQIPNQERGFKSISRQQQIIESLYLFLLQKREETEIKASATPANLKVIDFAYGSNIPVAPRKAIILLGALILGFIIPFSILYLRFLLDNKVHSRKDIEAVFSVPILGEIPSSGDTIIRDNDRSSLAESFRIFRTNMAFMLGTKKDSAVIYVTSTTSGEGKSFIATNLSKILAMSGKRVLLLGADIRSPKVLDYLGLSHLQHTNIGITQYLINPEMDIDNIIIKKPDSYQFDVIYSGFIAPNPAELLMTGHFDNIIQYGRDHYDFVIVDTAPVGLVTDTLLISENADLTIYVTRADYLDKRMLNVPKDLYESGKLRNMAVVLNDVDFAKGYGYGYGYGYGEEKKDSMFHKIRKYLRLNSKSKIQG